MEAVDPSDYGVVVMDAEPLVAYFLDEAGVDAVERVLRAVEDGTVDGCVHDVTLAEVFYVCARAADEEVAAEYVESLTGNGFSVAGSRTAWRDAGAIKIGHTIAIGDAYALSTARSLAATRDDVLFLVGADDDFRSFVGTGQDDAPDVVRFREDAD